jgi:hypothetical protein
MKRSGPRKARGDPELSLLLKMAALIERLEAELKLRLVAAGVVCCLVGCASQCTPVPAPSPGPTSLGGAGPLPVETGGTVGTGGQASFGGVAGMGTGGAGSSPAGRCIVGLSSDAELANVARRTSVSQASLVAKMCSDPAVLGAYR